VNNARCGAAGLPTGGSGEGQGVKESKLGCNRDTGRVRYSGNGAIIVRRLAEECPSSFVFKGPVRR